MYWTRLWLHRCSSSRRLQSLSPQAHVSQERASRSPVTRSRRVPSKRISMDSHEYRSSRAVAREVLQQETRIREQWRLIEQLESSGHVDVSKNARAVLRDICSALIEMRLEERQNAVRSREESAVLAVEETVTRGMRECPALKT